MRSVDAGELVSVNGVWNSVDGCWWISVDAQAGVSIDVERICLRIERSKAAGSVDKSSLFFLLLVMLGMHLKRKEKFYQ